MAGGLRVLEVTLRTAAGELFDIDTALRPNGNSGLLVTSIESFERYQRGRGSNTAWTWEHQALLRARTVAGAAPLCAALAAMAPLWPPGTASGYHPITFGYIAGEIFRRVDGRTMGTALREDLAVPLDLDLWIGLPDGEFPRVAQMERPKAVPDFGEMNIPTRAAFMTRWSSPGGRSGDEWRRAEIPSANGHATALALARLMGRLATTGEGVLDPATRDEMARERISGQDLVLPYVMSWGAGVMRNADSGAFGPGRLTFGHSGWGGSVAVCDPERRLGLAYVMNRQGTDLRGDPRARRLIDAVYGCL